MSVAERDAALMNAWKDREGSLANAEFEDGQVEQGYRRNVVSSYFSSEEALVPTRCAFIESQYLPIYMIPVVNAHWSPALIESPTAKFECRLTHCEVKLGTFDSCGPLAQPSSRADTL